MKNIEKYKNIVLENLNNCHLETSLRGLYGEKVVYCPHTNCGECKERFLKWLLSEYKEQILDDVEKAYLSAVIKPFRSRVQYIVKWKIYNDFKQFLHIDLSDGDSLSFPNFKADTMYRGMEVGKYYTPEELGL